MDFYFGKITEKETPNRIAPPPESVFADQMELHKTWFKPMLTVDLAQFNMNWMGKVHFFYCHANTDRAYFKLTDGKYMYLGDDLDEPIQMGKADMEDYLEPATKRKKRKMKNGNLSDRRLAVLFPTGF